MSGLLPASRTASLPAFAACVALSISSALTGCAEVNDLIDLEKARNEARYVPMEVAASLAMGVMRSQTYTAHSTQVQQAWSEGSPITEDGCIGVAVVDGFEPDGQGSVNYDFSSCPGQAGSVRVDQTMEQPELPELPELPEEEDEARDEDVMGGGVDLDGDGVPDELPQDPADIDWENLGDEALGSLLDTSADMSITYQNYTEGELHLAGSLTMSGGANNQNSVGGSLTAALDTEVFFYGGSINVDGSWTFGAAEGARNLSFSGQFVSTTQLGWTVVANKVGMTPGCMDATSGELTAIYDNPAGRIEVTAKFDAVCDGCSQLFINGVDQGQMCLPDMSAFIGDEEANAG